MMLDYPNEIDVQRLFSRGISDVALLQPEAIRAGRVRFFDDGTFEFAEDGERVVVFWVLESGIEFDLVAWHPQRNQLATWQGVAFALGQDAIWNPGTYFMGGALRVHRTALDWLKSDRDGICIVNPKLTYSQLHHEDRLIFSDAVYAAQVRRWMKPPEVRSQFLVEIEQVAA